MRFHAIRKSLRALCASAVLLTLATASTACIELESIPDEIRMEGTIVEVVRASAYRGDDYVRITRGPYPTALSDTDRIEVYVSGDAAAAFARVDPATPGSAVDLPAGTVIVREVITPAGALSALTVMMKGARGFFPAGGDWCYAVTEPSGDEFKYDDAGNPLAGRVVACASCHAERAQDDFLFGVPAAHRRDLTDAAPVRRACARDAVLGPAGPGGPGVSGR